MERVDGIGGLFLRARDPDGLAGWYQEHLGVRKTPESYEEQPWWQEPGPTGFAPFQSDTEYFGRAENQWMVNFRVSDLDAMTAQLREAGIELEVDPDVYPNGRFAHLVDPKGNRIEPWEPAGPELPPA